MKVSLEIYTKESLINSTLKHVLKCTKKLKYTGNKTKII